jgi:hypothetical protein
VPTDDSAIALLLLFGFLAHSSTGSNALGHEVARPGELSLIPVGFTFEARKSFLGRVLVSFGEPIPVAPYHEAYHEDPSKAVDALTRAIQLAMEAELVHVEHIEATELSVSAVMPGGQTSTHTDRLEFVRR